MKWDCMKHWSFMSFWFLKTCVTKSVAMGGLVQDPTLKTILQDSEAGDVKFIQEMQSILKRRHGINE
ncbi:hypothetical protein [Cytobacillus firmus]|uniref:Uncharacterized protein n=1 Tax=Cytobacillus firmus DS1 TaxID=1307436 RepID=W7L749_CYTFI|nr:hypothetical protein [Cytobacillus firmus]EWG11082.1 hypothetical protein PBF_11337 [Cytobacillus firmus DS1]